MKQPCIKLTNTHVLYTTVSEYNAAVSEFDALVCEYDTIVSEYDAVVANATK